MGPVVDQSVLDQGGTLTTWDRYWLVSNGRGWKSPHSGRAMSGPVFDWDGTHPSPDHNGPRHFLTGWDPHRVGHVVDRSVLDLGGTRTTCDRYWSFSNGREWGSLHSGPAMSSPSFDWDGTHPIRDQHRLASKGQGCDPHIPWPAVSWMRWDGDGILAIRVSTACTGVEMGTGLAKGSIRIYARPGASAALNHHGSRCEYSGCSNPAGRAPRVRLPRERVLQRARHSILDPS
jgi:hypothetical protein